MLDVKFWGTRGSIPVSLNANKIRKRLEQVLSEAVASGVDSQEKVQPFLDGLPFALAHSFGGNSSCVELDTGQGDYLLCDMGSGLREFAGHYLGNPDTQRSKTFHVFMSHLHWDHIMGFPFFTPAYIPDYKIKIYGCHDELEAAFRIQHNHPNFPVLFDHLLADIEFIYFKPGDIMKVNGFEVESRLQLHEGDSYGFRFSREGKSVIYSTDSEHKVEDQEELDGFVEFIKNADLVIFDAMYSLLESVTLKEDWGHSSNLMGVELCLRAAVKKLCLFHHDPIHDDAEIYRHLEEARSFVKLIGQEHKRDLLVEAAYDGLVLKV